MLDPDFANYVAEKASQWVMGPSRTDFLILLRDRPELIVRAVPNYIQDLAMSYIAERKKECILSPDTPRELVEHYKVFFASEIAALG